MSDTLLLKWGTLKGWIPKSDSARSAAQKYFDAGAQSPNGAMTQHDTGAQKQALCELIDAIDGEIQNDWTGEVLTKDQAKAYVLEYGEAERMTPSPELDSDKLASPWNEADCLAYDPFGGDDYGNDFVDFGAKIVTGRGEYECHICQGPIVKGERHRVDSCILDGERLHARFCGLCCAAMAISGEDDGEAITAREPDRWPS